jgi:glycosyltransferase involved in cell wall biosynthesis
VNRDLKELSIVIPIHNEESVLPKLIEALDRVRRTELKEVRSEVILVDDGSSDRSWSLISAQCLRDPAYVGIKLSRNFGQQYALTAGLEASRGKAVISMDADLQDPPEIIPKLLAAHQEGYDVVYATRTSRGEESWGKSLAANIFYFALAKVSGVPIQRNAADFRLMSRRSLLELSKLRESHRFVRGLVPWIGFPQTQIHYERANRQAGKTHYSWNKLLRLGFDGIASMSQLPLRLAYGTCLILFLLFFSYIIYEMIFSNEKLMPGWSSLMCAIIIFGTAQLLVIAVFGEYLGRVHEQVKNRPLYIVEEIQRSDCEMDSLNCMGGIHYTGEVQDPKTC